MSENRFYRVQAGATSFLSRNLTAVSIAVTLLGVVLLVLGPILRNGRGRDFEVAPEQSGEEGIFQPFATGGKSNQAALVLDREPEPFTIVPTRNRSQVVTYTVTPGDTVFGIAERYGLDMQTIFWSNTEKLQDNVHLLNVGVEVYILPVNGVYHRSSGDQTITEIAERYLADPKAVLDSPANEFAPDATVNSAPPLGMRVVVPGGQRERVEIPVLVAETTTDPTTGVTQTVTRFAPGHPGSCAVTSGGGGTGVWGLPVSNYRFTQAYHFGHDGVDLAGVTGEPIYAADTGRVIFAGWSNWGYGNLVVLDHGNGWSTFYAHMSSVSVGCQQTVTRGSVVGAMGSTGQSTGPHLHFEMRWNFVADNPSSWYSF